MRTLVAGLVCLVIGIGITEYARRNPSKTEAGAETDTKDNTPSKPKWPKEVATLLETEAPGTDAPGTDAELAALLTVPSIDGANFPAVAGGAFEARQLSGGFGAALFVIDAKGKSGLVRAAAGDAPKLLFSRNAPINAISVDGSTVFFAEGGLIGSTLARGGEGVTVRARFKNAVVTSLASSGDTVVATVMPRSADPASTDAVGAVISIDSDGKVSLIAQEQVKPRAAQTDGKGAYWIAGYPAGLWRGALDGAFSSQLADTADEPIALDGDAVYFRAPLGSGVELKRVGRAGGNMSTVATADVNQLVVQSGLVRFTTAGATPKLYEVTSGAEPTEVLTLSGAAKGLALGGTTLFVLTTGADGASLLRAK
ncbi:MAG: hypothetical protein DI536_28340 [Archangium gephyra]|uniref:Uncharacterized protein n=1 Tax=Archangium gephyra TaxID=48 RepID=A0A2W5VAJ4_9BACT|nr:MAG: hypothetical protein DI536_28340 [Archangium gephyra]